MTQHKGLTAISNYPPLLPFPPTTFDLFRLYDMRTQIFRRRFFNFTNVTIIHNSMTHDNTFYAEIFSLICYASSYASRNVSIKYYSIFI